tara:strand:+ start:219 stop:980 length:762 start_codon:yes stop_codon:yes gene_type:complete
MPLKYDNITDPNKGNKIKINSKNGKSIIKKYSNLLDKQSIDLEKKDNKKQKSKTNSEINKQKKTKEAIKVIDIDIENEKILSNKDNKIIDDLNLLADPQKISKKKKNIINNKLDEESYVASVSTVSSVKSELSDKSNNTKLSDKSINTKISNKSNETKISDKSDTKLSDQLLDTKIIGGSEFNWNNSIKENKNNNSFDSLIRTKDTVLDNKTNKKSTSINITELFERTISLEEEVSKLKYLLKNLANEVSIKL